MDKKQQIEEMARDLEETQDCEYCDEWHCDGCHYEKYGKNYFCSKERRMAEKEYIEREALIKFIDERGRGLCLTIPNICNFKEITRMIPAADVVPKAEVVRVIEQIKEHINEEAALVGAQSSYKLFLWFAELKKKYTEGGGQIMLFGTKKYRLSYRLKRWFERNFSAYNPDCNKQCAFGIRGKYEKRKCKNRFNPLVCGECWRADRLKRKKKYTGADDGKS